MPRVLVFYHACAMGDWRAIVWDQLSRLAFAGLWTGCDRVYATVVGPEAATCAHMIGAFGAKAEVEVAPDDTSHERITLLKMRRTVGPGDKALYLHSKGVTKPGPPLAHPAAVNVALWRTLMEYHLVACWRGCVRLLDDYDCVGCNFKADRPHFSGNFFWARGDYLRTLPDAVGPGYLDPELWPCLARPRVCEVASTPVDCYREACPPAEYLS